jgi:hypothetical protein
MASPSMLFGEFSELMDFCTHEFAHAEQEGRMYEGDVSSFYASTDSFIDSFSQCDLSMSQQSNSQSYSACNLSPELNCSDSIFTSVENRSNDFYEVDMDFNNSESEHEQPQAGSCLLTGDSAHLSKFIYRTSSKELEDAIQLVGSTYMVNLNSSINIQNLSQTFKHVLPENVKKSRYIPKKITKSRSSSCQSVVRTFRNSIPFKLDLAFLNMDGFASGNIFSNGRILLSSIKTDDDDLVKSILNVIAESIQEAHFTSMDLFCAPVIQCSSNDLILILPQTFAVVPQLQLSVPFRIKYSRLDEAFQQGLLESVNDELTAVKSRKEKATGHGYLIKYDCFSVTIYHTGMIQARTFKPHLSRSQLKNALLRVHTILMSIQSLIEVQGDDAFDGSTRRNPKVATSKSFRTGASLFKPKQLAATNLH